MKKKIILRNVQKYWVYDTDGKDERVVICYGKTFKSARTLEIILKKPRKD